MGIKKISMLFVLISTINFVACSDNTETNRVQQEIKTLKAEAENAKETEKAETQPLDLPEHITYQSRGFGRAASVTDQKRGSYVNPLLAYNLSEYQFVGVLVKNNDTSAYLLTPDGLIHLVTVGDIIGIQKNKVVKITASQIELLETEDNDNNEVQQKTNIIYLKDEKNG